jgi:hypothetical protein
MRPTQHGADAAPESPPAVEAQGAPRLSVEAVRRVAEPVAIAVLASTGLYLVGTVYVDAYYGRMSIEASALDLAPPFVALQSTHVLSSVLEYPVGLLLLYLLYRFSLSRLPRLRSWSERVRRRFGRSVLVVANGLLIAPLVIGAYEQTRDAAVMRSTSVLREATWIMGAAVFGLVVYVLWLSLARRQFLFAALHQRQLGLFALLALLWLLDSLPDTAREAAADAELLMTGASEASMSVVFRPAAGIENLPAGELLLVTMRNGHYFVVKRQGNPPSPQPVAYAVPFRAVDAIRLQRSNPSALADDDL